VFRLGEGIIPGWNTAGNAGAKRGKRYYSGLIARSGCPSWINLNGASVEMPFASRSVIFDEFRFILPTRELLRIANDGSSTPILLGSRAAEILYLLLQRHGEVVSKKEIVDAVWPQMAIEESNLTVQISALRRVLDDGRNGSSCIQTAPGRGYRLTSRVAEADRPEPCRSVAGAPIPDGADSLADARPTSPESLPAASSPADIGGRGSGNGRIYGGVAGFLCAALIAYSWQGFRTDKPARPTEPPRLSIVVLPFANASGTPKDEELAAALTDDFTTDLAQIRGSVVVARSMAQVIAARKLPLPAVGRELAVRYVLEGNIRRSPEGMELNVQLSDAASATSIWTRQFEEAASEPGDLRLQVARSLLFPLRRAFMDAEARRVASLPDAMLTADDLLLRVSALDNHLPITPANDAESVAMLERASALDPTSAEVMVSLADHILRPILSFNDRTSIDERLLRVQTLADRARALAADSASTLELRARILRVEGRFDEALAAYAELVRSSGRFRVDVARCLIALGRSAEAVPLLEESTRLDRDMRARFSRYWSLGAALVHIGRYEEAITWLRAANEAFSGSSPGISWNLAIAYAHDGKVADARRELLEFAKRMGGVFTVRYLRHAAGTLGEDYAREVGGPFMALLPDHTREDADAGLPMTEGVRSANLIRMTPIGAPGVSTIKTSELRALIGDGEGGASGELPLLLSTNCGNCLRVTIPGANFVPNAYRNGVLDDAKRQAVKALVDRLLHGDRTRRVIIFSWNPVFWDARNLAIELVSLGYPNVSWYRGGLEAWDVAGLPLASLK
jgi:DNA-binding winged helix-turn-helix (wHTH) protein/TolB-like protein